MTPVLSPPPSSSTTSLTSLTSTGSPIPMRRISSGSVKSLVNSFLTTPIADDYSGVAIEAELRHAQIKLDARHYKNSSFALQLLEIIRTLQVPSWTRQRVGPEPLVIQKMSGALTNAVFFVSCPSVPSIRTLLLRVYGSSSGSLISRPRELHILHILSSRYKIGPHVYGTFENGRLEEYFDSVTLTPTDIRDPEISRWIGSRMAELHSVDIVTVEGPTSRSGDDENGWEVVANLNSWLGPAMEVLKLPTMSDDIRHELDLPKFKEQWDLYLAWITKQEGGFGRRRVFAHNDAQYGNLLRLKDAGGGLDEHRQIIVVDFEYAAPNPAAFDIVNHFHEWTANYHCPTPDILTPSLYPSLEQRHNFYATYVQHAFMLADDPGLSATELSNLIAGLDQDVCMWSAASHANWAIWGIVQAREDLERGVVEPEFDYIGYAKGRMSAFRQDLENFGLL